MVSLNTGLFAFIKVVSTLSEQKRYIVEFYGVSEPEVIEAAGGTVRHNFNSLSEKLSAMLSDEAIEHLLLEPSIKAIEEVNRGNGSAQSTSWEYTYTQVSTRYRGYYNGSGVKVAVVDTGIATHSDLPNTVAFHDCISGRSSQYDDHGHGTFIAGLIAAQDNDVGYVGTAPGVSLYGCKVLDSNNRGYADDFVAGIEWAVSQGVDIINFSIYMDDPGETTVRDACRAAYNAGVIVVSCSGNGIMNDYVAVAVVGTPAVDYSCVAVGSINSSGTRSSFSNYGTGLDLVAPGESVNSTNNTGEYWGWSGTSFAAAVVVGHLAIIKQRYPGYSRSQLVSKLLSLCNGNGSAWEYGAGCIMAEAVSSATTYLSTPTTHGCRWSIYNLSSYWDDDYYQQAVLSTKSNHPSGSSSEPSGILSRQYPPSNGTNYNTPSVTFSSGLQPNTQYTLYGYCRAKNGLWYPAGSATVTTDMLKLPTPYLSSYGSTTTSVTFTIAAVTNATYYWVDWWKEGVYQGSTGHTSSNRTFSYTNLEPNSSYIFKYYCSNIGNYYDSDTNTLNIKTTDPTPGIPTNNNNIPGNKQVTVTWNKPSSNTYLDGYWFYYKQHNSGTWIAAGGQDTQNSSVTKVFTGLTNGISYDFMVRAYAYEGGYYYPSGNSTTVTATPVNTRPGYFSWDTPKVQGQSFNLTATEWNRLIQNVKDVHTYKLGSYNATSYPMSTVSKGDTFFATLFNQVRFAIGSLNSTGISQKISGNVITAADLNTLRDKLNGIN